MVLSQKEISRETYGSGLLVDLKYTITGASRIGLASGFGHRHRSWRIRIQRIKGEHSMKKYQFLIIGTILILVAGIVLPMANAHMDNITIQGSGQTEIQQEGSIILATPIPGGKVHSGYGKRRNPFTNKVAFHQGVDIPMDKDTPVRTAADGVILKAVSIDNSHSGKYILIEHNQGFRTRYTHLEEVLVEKDQIVKAGDIIGLVGETGQSNGPHLHFELIKDNKPVNPEEYITF
jgi:murein DD-endopeptidase MepM/ murein hydrolase activator NlpD